MNAPVTVAYSACPHDCPSTCALEVDVLAPDRIGRVRGSKDNSYTDGVICAKVARYAERIHHPDRLTKPMIRTGPKGSGQFREASWDEALDLVAEKFLAIEAEHGAEAIWPYYYAGTMGLVMRDGINRLRHAKGYSRMHGTFCTTMAFTGYIAGTGLLAGVDPREMAKSDCVVIWGTNPVNTQVNVMTHAIKARKERGAKIVAIDVYRNGTIDQADMGLILKPGTDGALACAVMHIAFRDGHADRDYMAKYTDDPAGLEAHLADRTPEWAAEITGLGVEEIEAFAKLVGETPRTFFRLGYGFTRGRNGSVNMHAALCVPAVLGSWRHEGGGAFHNNGAIYHWDRGLIEGLDAPGRHTRILDQSRIGPVLTGDRRDLGDGPPIMGLFMQNTNPAMVAPELNKVHAGLAREDLFTCVHEQFLTETAQFADVVLPATMFLEHTDLYQGGGHQHILLGPKAVDAPEGCRSNHEVICALAERLGAEHRGFAMGPEEIIDETLKNSGWPGIDELREKRWFDVQPDFETAHYLNGFGHPDGRFRFRPDWSECAPKGFGPDGAPGDMPAFPDYWGREDRATPEKPFRMSTSPARNFLNSSFTETPTSKKRENRPTVKIGPADAGKLGIADGQLVRLSNERGTVRLHAEVFDGLRPGVIIVESVWPNAAFVDGLGINALTSAEPGAPVGGGLFHDTAVAVEAA
ncbi:molybdopterin-containing oxidoreductase family protein [Minwuia thermotolerans]|uniref:Dehydrogenase n=1 Tax=Minwuia thermotolerans TaxID=2056226 RepID=A0A2M9G6V4_9PROT|nr:molybdopterin oxidoreductase family protein [Minwuia thermotolerans]PJK31442.1 dehydrogenase [Minwuia thermotolerans]